MGNTTTVKTTKPRGRPAKATRSSHPKRVPLMGGQKRMHIDEEDKDPSFHYAWINDLNDLIRRAKRAGFDHVTVEEMPNWGSISVDSANPAASVISMPVGGGRVAFLMKQPMEFYEEDMQAKADRLKKKESGMIQELNSGKDGGYGKVEFERT